MMAKKENDAIYFFAEFRKGKYNEKMCAKSLF